MSRVPSPGPHPSLPATPGQAVRLFFETSEIDRIRANAQTPFLRPTFEAWRDLPASEAEAQITKVLETGDLLYHWGAGLEAIYRQATLTLLTGEAKHRDLTMLGLETLHTLPAWDYLLDGGKPIGIMRASKATTATLLSLEVLSDELDDDYRERMLRDVAEKGCDPCARTIHQMNNPEEAEGWEVDDVQKPTYNWDMSRWPWILAVNNLRAIPTMGLGLGALALDGRDDRVEQWRSTAIDSTRRYFDLFEDDGSYFEGISYIDYAFRTLFLFLEADNRIHGEIDWVEEGNLHGIVNYIAALQAGKKENGEPDIVNISDARHSVFTCVTSWVANQSDDGLAAYAAQHFSRPGYFADFLWYRPEREGTPPPESLKNVKMDLGWIVARSGWDADDTVLSFRSGGPMNHEHADRNSFMLKAKGERLLTEHFGASYRASDPHWLLRLPVAHNAVLVDGQGHQYHNGEEGTNAGLASAEIVQYEDHGDVVFWTSDATQGYEIVDDRITLVRRSVIFKKPGLVILVDEVEASEPVEAQILFHPDNRDNQAALEILTGGEFAIVRPRARLRGRCYSEQPVQIEYKELELPTEHGEFPYLDAIVGPSQAVRVLTTIQIGDDIAEVSRSREGWGLRVDGAEFVRIGVGRDVPTIVMDNG